MPLLKFGRKNSDKASKDQSLTESPKNQANLDSDQASSCSPPLIADSTLEESITPKRVGSPKSVRIDETSLAGSSAPISLSRASREGLGKKQPTKSSFAHSKKPIKDPGQVSIPVLTEGIITDASSDGYQSSRESIQSPSTPATSIGSSSYPPFQHREIAQGFEKRVAQLPPPPPRTPSNMKISLGHGKDGNRPAFQIGSPSKKPPSRTPKSPKEDEGQN